MGSNLARNFAPQGFVTAVHNRTYAKTEALLAEHTRRARSCRAESAAEFVASLAEPRTIIIMVKAGGPTDAVIDELSELLEPGDIIVDGGNALVHRHHPPRGGGARQGHQLRRLRHLRRRGGRAERPVDHARRLGESYESLGPILETIAALVEGEPCCTHIGPDGAGHFVKMVHNGIEYADMQLIAEAYDLLRRGAGLTTRPRSPTSSPSGTRGELESYLIEITAEVLRQVDADDRQAARGRRSSTQAGQKGTGAWTVQTALDLGVPVSGIAEAVFARGAVVATRAAGGGAARRCPARPTPGPSRTATRFIEDVRLALYASKIVAYSQGFDEIAGRRRRVRLGHRPAARSPGSGAAAASSAPSSSTASPRRTTGDPNLPSRCCSRPTSARPSAARRTRGAGWSPVPPQSGIPTPAFSSALAYYDGLRSRAAARRPHPGPARLLRRAHLQARRQGRHLPHAVVGRPHRDRVLSS